MVGWGFVPHHAPALQCRRDVRGRKEAAVEELVRGLNGLCDEQPFHTGWYLKDLRSGQEAHRAGDLVGPSASTRKIAILMAGLKAGYEGRLSLDQPVTIDAKHHDHQSG